MTVAPSKPEGTIPLAAEFPPSTDASWRAAVDKVLTKRGETDVDPALLEERYHRQLVTETVDGLVIQPLYRSRDTEAVAEAGVPGAAPFVRGATVRGNRRFGWDVRQQVLVTADSAATSARVLDELERGTTSVLLVADDPVLIELDHLDEALKGVYLDLVPIVLGRGSGSDRGASALAALWERRGHLDGDVAGSLGLDPVARWADGTGGVELDRATRSAVAWARRCAERHPKVRALAIDAALIHECGGGEVEELGFAMASGLHQLRQVVADGLTLEAAAGQLEFRFAATPDQFLTIAKLRAARRMWQRVADVSGVPASGQAQLQHVVSSTAAAARYDPWVNLLRSTVECFGAGVGGAQAVTVLPHDELLERGGTDIGRRLARNTQLVLIEESHLARVLDIPGGSWYVESLTDQLARAGWAWFQAIEAEGGAVAALASGMVQERVAEVAAARAQRISRRTHPITGLTEFPDIGETPPAPEPSRPTGAIRPDIPLVPVRHGAFIEQLRGRADRAEADGTGRPQVFLANLGPPAVHTARATWAKNLFEVGGIRAVPGPGHDDAAEVVAAFAGSGARLACICSNDARSLELGPAVAAALHEAGATRIYLAGRPSGADDLLAHGIDEIVTAGCDINDVLRRALDVAGAPA